MSVTCRITLQHKIDCFRYLYSCESTPRALVAFYRQDTKQRVRAGRPKMYRRIYCFLWVIGARFTTNFTLNHHAPSRPPSFQYGSHVRAGHFEGSQPCCIYHEALKAVVRASFPNEQATKSKPDPEGSSVSTRILQYKLHKIHLFTSQHTNIIYYSGF